jgi:NitT/TauT family transport system substrate-binding protein
MNGQKPKPLFYIAVAVVVVGLVAFAIWRFGFSGSGEEKPTQPQPGPLVEKPLPPSTVPALDEELLKKIVEAKTEPDRLDPAGEYRPKGDVVDCEISEWPGYAPIIVANGGLEPNPDSYFAKNHGFKLKIKVSEGEIETWNAINSGKLGISVTTVDVLALYGPQLKIEVPVQLDFSRGGDGILTLKEITSINQLKGKVITVAQFTEAEFFIRFLAQEAGLQVKPMKGIDDDLDADKINLLFTEKADDAAKLFAESVKKGSKFISGAVTWSPFTVEVPDELPDQVRLLTSNRNLLVVADIVIVNQAFAKANPKIVKGLTEGILWATEEIRKNPDATLPVVAKAFSTPDEPTTLQDMKELMQDVHLSNHAENMLFFSPETGQIGNFRELYYSAVYAYGTQIIKTPAPPERLVNRTYLEDIAKEGLYKDQKVTIAPVKSEKGGKIENPLLTKAIHFKFEPDSAVLDLNDQANKDALKDLATMLKLAPGSHLHLVGHVDDRNLEEFKKKGEAFLRRQAVRAVDLSKQRAEAVRTVLMRDQKLEADRIVTDGRGWNEPLVGASHDENRRVEVQLFTLE